MLTFYRKFKQKYNITEQKQVGEYRGKQLNKNVVLLKEILQCRMFLKIFEHTNYVLIIQ